MTAQSRTTADGAGITQKVRHTVKWCGGLSMYSLLTQVSYN